MKLILLYALCISTNLVAALPAAADSSAPPVHDGISFGGVGPDDHTLFEKLDSPAVRSVDESVVEERFFAAILPFLGPAVKFIGSAIAGSVIEKGTEAVMDKAIGKANAETHVQGDRVHFLSDFLSSAAHSENAFIKNRDPGDWATVCFIGSFDLWKFVSPQHPIAGLGPWECSGETRPLHANGANYGVTCISFKGSKIWWKAKTPIHPYTFQAVFSSNTHFTGTEVVLS